MFGQLKKSFKEKLALKFRKKFSLLCVNIYLIDIYFYFFYLNKFYFLNFKLIFNCQVILILNFCNVKIIKK